MQGVVLAALGSIALLATPAVAGAEQRYASPGGSGTTCSSASPCSLATAVEAAADYDEVLLKPGDYGSPTARVQGPGTVSDGVWIHGETSTPQLWLSGALGLGPSGRLSDVRIDSSSTGVSGPVADLTIEHVLVRADGTGMDLNAGNSELTVTNSVVSGNWDAIYIGLYPGSATATFRNVTAIGAFGRGIASLSCLANAALSLTATNVIADGSSGDFSADEGCAANVSMTFTVDHSNYDSVEAVTNPGTITPPGTGTNQTAPPAFLDAPSGDYRQALTSPTVDAGAESSANGTTDFEGQQRSFDSPSVPNTPMRGPVDIGGDEAVFLPTARTNVAQDLTTTGATLGADVTTAGLATQAFFRYGTAADQLASTTPSQDVGSGAATVTVTQAISGLQPGTTYFFRAVAENAEGTVEGDVHDFTTGGTAPGTNTSGGSESGDAQEAAGTGTNATGSSGAAPLDTAPPILTIRAIVARLATVLRRGLSMRLACTEPCAGRVELLASARDANRLRLSAVRRPIVVGRASFRLTAAGQRVVTVKLNRRAARRMRKVRRLTLTARISAADAAGNRAVTTRRVRLRR